MAKMLSQTPGTQTEPPEKLDRETRQWTVLADLADHHVKVHDNTLASPVVRGTILEMTKTTSFPEDPVAQALLAGEAFWILEHEEIVNLQKSSGPHKGPCLQGKKKETYNALDQLHEGGSCLVELAYQLGLWKEPVDPAASGCHTVVADVALRTAPLLAAVGAESMVQVDPLDGIEHACFRCMVPTDICTLESVKKVLNDMRGWKGWSGKVEWHPESLLRALDSSTAPPA